MLYKFTNIRKYQLLRIYLYIYKIRNLFVFSFENKYQNTPLITIIRALKEKDYSSLKTEESLSGFGGGKSKEEFKIFSLKYICDIFSEELSMTASFMIPIEFEAEVEGVFSGLSTQHGIKESVGIGRLLTTSFS